MAKKRRSSGPDLSSIFLSKKTSATAIIGLLVYIITQILNIHPSFPSSLPTSFPSPTTPTQLPESSQPVQLYSNQTQDDLVQLYTSAIRSAQKSVNLVIYTLNDSQVMEAIKEKAASGVPVYIVCDAQASKGISRLAGPNVTIVRRAGKGLTHQKILVIDDTRIILGSSNLSHDSLRVYGNLVIGLENPALAQLLSDKIRSMDQDGKSIPLLHKDAIVGNQQVELWILPDDQQAAERVLSLFRAAKKSIKIAMFTWTRRDFTEELIRAAKRGVKVEAVVDRYAGKGAGAKTVKMLSEAGIPIGLSTGKGLLHHKFAYIDDTILVNGSANWTLNAFKNNDDTFLILQPLTAEQQNKLNRLWTVITNESEKAK